MSSSSSPENSMVSQEMDEEENGPGEFHVEKILGKRMFEGKLQYLVKWLDFDDPSDNTWESKENCMKCPGRIREFEASLKKKKETGKKGGRGRPKSVEKKGPQNGPNAREKPRKSAGYKEEMEADEKVEEVPPPADSEPYLPEPEEGKIYGVQQGKALAKVLGVKRSEQFGMVALVCYEQGDYELVPTNVITEVSPKALMIFYENRTRFM